MPEQIETAHAETTPEASAPKQVVFQKGQKVILAGVTFVVSQVTEKILVLRPLETGTRVRFKRK